MGLNLQVFTNVVWYCFCQCRSQHDVGNFSKSVTYINMLELSETIDLELSQCQTHSALDDVCGLR